MQVCQEADSKLYGFILGPGGLVDHNYMELTSDIIDEYRNTGGFDIIGSGRTKLEKVEQFDKGLEIIKELGIKALELSVVMTQTQTLVYWQNTMLRRTAVFRLSVVRRLSTVT